MEARRLTEPQLMKAKICLVGEHAVGKTSLIRRFVLDEFDDRYITTLGAKVSKKEFDISTENMSPVSMDMTIWDIMGSKGFRELLREAYFHGAQGILAVCDVTREETLGDLDAWVESVFRTVGDIPVVFAINKMDLKHKAMFGEDEVKQATEAFDAPYFFTSAKKGENVDQAFQILSKAVFEKTSGMKATVK
jgi:small GTP-binding protein